jgi:hypothetical protein
VRGKTLATGACLTLTAALFFALSLGACGQKTPVPAPTAPPSGSRLLWQGTLGPEDVMAPGEPVTVSGGGFWLSFSVSGGTGTRAETRSSRSCRRLTRRPRRFRRRPSTSALRGA